eukprot:5228119-Pyramimonas_sp.AAC.1
MVAIYTKFEEGREWVEYLGEVGESVGEMRESGELDFYVFSLVIGLIAIWWVFGGSKDTGTEYVGSESDDDSVASDVTTESEEADSKTAAMMETILAGQQQMAELMQA